MGTRIVGGAFATIMSLALTFGFNYACMVALGMDDDTGMFLYSGMSVMVLAMTWGIFYWIAGEIILNWQEGKLEAKKQKVSEKIGFDEEEVPEEERRWLKDRKKKKRKW